MRIIGRINKEILPYFFHHPAEKTFVPFAPEKDPARFEVVARRMANEVPGAVTRVLKMVVHPFHVSWHPADSAFEKGEFKVSITI
jgi:hypothetical protein